MSNGRPEGAETSRIIMLNIKTGEERRVWGMPAAAKIVGYSVSKVQYLINNGRADKNGWTFDIEE